MKSMLSKSQYVKGCQCPKALWFSLNRKDLTPPVDVTKQAIFNAGNQVGDWAKKYFPDGVEITVPFYKTDEGADATHAFVAAGNTVIFEATAIHTQDATHARIDILRKVPGTDTWDMIEVKGSTGVKDYHYDDMAFQYRVFTGAGFQINRCHMMLIDNKYERQGDVDPQQLFKLEDITALVLAKQSDVNDMIPSLHATLACTDEPQAKIGSRCFKPFDCDYIAHCWNGVPDYSIYNVLTGKKADEVVQSLGSYEVKRLPAHLIPKGTKGKDVQSYVSGQVEFNPDKIREFLATLQYPLYYLDYETIASAVPIFEGTRPFQTIPFQFSLHIEETPGAKLKHREFLHKERSDPRPAFIDALICLCGTDGTIIVYNQPFEKGVNEKLMLDYPQHAVAISAINARMIDLLVPFKNRWLYHPDQHSSASIKRVLPAHVLGLSYEGLNISNGQDASQKYLDFILNKTAPEKVHELWAGLEEYCGLDTFAMKALIDVLRGKIAV